MTKKVNLDLSKKKLYLKELCNKGKQTIVNRENNPNSELQASQRSGRKKFSFMGKGQQELSIVEVGYSGNVLFLGGIIKEEFYAGSGSGWVKIPGTVERREA